MAASYDMRPAVLIRVQVLGDILGIKKFMSFEQHHEPNVLDANMKGMTSLPLVELICEALRSSGEWAQGLGGLPWASSPQECCSNTLSSLFEPQGPQLWRLCLLQECTLASAAWVSDQRLRDVCLPWLQAAFRKRPTRSGGAEQCCLPAVPQEVFKLAAACC